MLFWALMAVFAVLTVVIYRTSGFTEAPMHEQIPYLVIISLMALLALTTHFHVRRMQVKMVHLGVGFLAFLVLIAVNFREDNNLMALSLLEQEPESSRPGRNGQEVMLLRAWDGHFRAVADVNGTAIGLLVDTGASMVLIRHDDAIRIGVPMNQLNYTVPVSTAGGRSFVAPFNFAEVRVGDVVVHDVRGAVAKPGTLHSSLLGMSFIEKLDEATIRRDRLYLRN